MNTFIKDIGPLNSKGKQLCSPACINHKRLPHSLIIGIVIYFYKTWQNSHTLNK